MLRLSIHAAVLLLCSAVLLQAGQGEPVLPATPLKDVGRVQILPTVVSDPKTVKNPDAAEMVQQSLRRSVLANDIQVTESAPIKVRLLLDEFSGGNFAKRFAIGLGAGRSSVSCRIQLLGPGDNEIANVRVKVRGDLSWGGYEGNATQTRQAVNKFELALTDEIAKWQGPRLRRVP